MFFTKGIEHPLALCALGTHYNLVVKVHYILGSMNCYNIP